MPDEGVDVLDNLRCRGVTDPEAFRHEVPHTRLHGKCFWMWALGRAAQKIGHMMSCMSFLLMAGTWLPADSPLVWLWLQWGQGAQFGLHLPT